MIYRLLIKRLLDLLLAVLGLVIFFPVMVIVLLLLTISLRGNPFFFQLRPGRNGRPFYLIKFRSMRVAYGADRALLPDELRLTPIGKKVRALSLDELPQLINVIFGNMSLVGPRPLLMDYLPLYNQDQMRRHEVRPGITGWAQVNGRNGINWEDKFKLDVWYVDTLSLWLDLKILWLTVRKVVVREGISQEGQATMEPFKG